ncbi:ATP-binding cassette domain-containing protein [Sulfitobacter mediterraneus]|uniref:Sugar ABC transporter ATP-binding protein n=1 Tax=Sulfitobacter mediterraneus TaxID=83219 RepID=A0A061SWB9_9RHOB|nr:ATP-binding cassette domain-containing protein [Sulfitobacter mediterraneus]KAJ04248.1 sugar ABC transporter ATP-binding protein [Sulfitobacter mediterraneus]
MTAPNKVVEMTGIEKRFGPVEVLRGVDFELYENEVLALLGDNGAGKSTLIKTLSGYYQPDAGQIQIGGQAVSFGTPHEARDHGIETIYQDLALFDNLDVAANVFAGKEKVGGGWRKMLGFVDRKAMRNEAREAVSQMAINIPRIDQEVSAFSGGQRQCVAIAKSVMWGRKVVIMDEPTAALGVRETGKVLDLIRTLKSHNLSVIVIMHNIEHVMEVAERAIVMRSGTRRGTVNLNGPQDRESHDEIVKMLM